MKVSQQVMEQKLFVFEKELYGVKALPQAVDI